MISGDVLLVRYLTDRKKKSVQCLQEMIGFIGGVTYGITEWKRTLEKAILQEKHQGMFPGIFQEKFLEFNQTYTLRDSLQKALEELPISRETTQILSRYFMTVGKDTKKATEDHYRHTKNQLEEILKQLREELPKTEKLIAVGVYAISAMIAVLLL